jgi:hypothetical protein
MKVVTTDKVDSRTWDLFVENHPFGSVYHHSAWQGVIRKTYGYRPVYSLIQDDSSNLRAALSSAFVDSSFTGKRITAYPFSDSCDPLVRDLDEADMLVRAHEDARRDLGAAFVEFRLAMASRYMNTHDQIPEYQNHLLVLDREPEALFRSFHKNSIQQTVKKAQNGGIEIRRGDMQRDLEIFYHLHLMTRKKHGVPVQPFRFFRNLWDALAPLEMLTLLLAHHEQKCVAGIIVLWFKGIGYYKYAASDDRFLRLRANQLLVWESIRLAIEKGCTIFDFGRTSSTNVGLSQYKSRWSTKRVPLHSIRLPENNKPDILNESSKKHALLKRFFSKMPLPVIRLSGELLYKHFA